MRISPLWIILEDSTNLPLVLKRSEWSSILRTIADQVEERGLKRLDLDPCETADWLRQEAYVADIE
jgi:hypothetical protein